MKKWAFGALFIMAALYIGWSLMVTTGTWRYRLTLTVNDNNTLHTGSSVIEISVLRGLEFLPEMQPLIQLKGEAVAVDIGDRGTLFALLSKESNVDYAKMLVFLMFPTDVGGTTPQGIRYYRALEGKRDIPFDKLPMLVRFIDMNDAQTVKKVDPNNLKESFGNGVKLEKATIEMTKSPVTTGIQKRLPWLPGRKETTGYLGGWPEDKSGLYLNGSEFSQGIF